MIVQVLRLTHWELFKVRKRWMPWILLTVVVVLTQLALWGDYSAYRNVGRYERIWGATFSEENSVSITVDITCVDVVEDNVDTKLALIPEPAPSPWFSRVSALEAVEEARASGHCEEVLERHAQERKRYREGLVLPSSLSNGLGVANFYGIPLIMILGALAMGVEFGWGTLRTALTRGIGRWQFLGAKVFALLLMSSAGLIIVALFAAVSSVVFASLISGDGGGLADSGKWSSVAVMYGKAIYGLVPYIVLALFMSVLTSSSSMGIATSLAYFFVEITIIQILGRLAWFSNFSDFLLGPSIAGWMSETGVRSNTWIAEVGEFIRSFGLVKVSELPGQLHAFLVLTAYIAVLGGVALWLFYRKDIAGARGE